MNRKCPKYKVNKASRVGKCETTGRAEGCSGKTRCCPLKGMDNINFGKVR